MKQEPVTVPDLGGAEDVEVIEVSVSEGAVVAAEQTLVVLESDKASMELPSPMAGTVAGIRVKPGDRVRQGDLIMHLAVEETPGSAAKSEPPAAAQATQPAVAAAAVSGSDSDSVALLIPDLGGAESVEVIEISARAGDSVKEGDALLVLESDKATMELPAPVSGSVVSIDVRVGARVQGGQRIGELRTGVVKPVPRQGVTTPQTTTAAAVPTVAAPATEGDSAVAITRVLEKERRSSASQERRREARVGESIYAGPAVRLLAREMGVTLSAVSGTGPKGRILKQDVQAYVKARLAAPQTAPASALPTVPAVDFAAFGPIETVALTQVQRATVVNMTRSWLNVPHVTQFDYADVNELETFRESLKPEMEQRSIKLTPLPFLLIAVARALREHPRFNASLHPDGKQLVLKQYMHVGIAVDTPQGLMVPVIRDVNTKSMWELAAESRELADKARNRKLRIADMQGACFTLSSLGNIGGEGFTPIINTPEVAILGVSKLAIRPLWNGSEFVPRKTLPLSLSYDHRVVNGADAGNFLTYLVGVLGDIRLLLL